MYRKVASRLANWMFRCFVSSDRRFEMLIKKCFGLG